VKIKLDENLGRRCAALFEAAGYDTATVVTQKLCGAGDAEVIDRCRMETRALVTMALDLGNPLLFKPSDYHGIAVLRPRSPASLRELEELCRTPIGGMARENIDGKLWIVELGRIRIYQEDTPE
jgi:predicted nuclease of predicted toxin-antitoxin system